MIGGGLWAVMWTDLVQTVLMIVGAVWLMILSFHEVGGYESLLEKYLRFHKQPLSIFATFHHKGQYHL